MPDAPKLPDDWTEPERWAWEQIAAGKIADFNALAQETDDDAVPLDPKSSDGWTADRRLRAAFIRTILTELRFVEATPFGGVRIRGALVDDKTIDLEHARLPHQFWLGESRIKVAVLGGDLRVDGGMSFSESFVVGRLDLNGAKIGQLLSMQCASFENGVYLTGASIGCLSMTGARFAKKVSLNGATITGSAFLDTCECPCFENAANLTEKPLDLTGANIGGRQVTKGARFEKALDLIGASIGGQLSMKGARFAGRVQLDGATIEGSAFLDTGASFEAKLELTGASIGADLVLSDATFASTVYLTNARIGSELRLGSNHHPPARWGSGSKLILRNSHCASLQDCWPTPEEPKPRSWPDEIDLEGFTYDLLGGLAGDGGGPADMRARPASSYIAWLERQEPFSPQPYEQLAKVLRASGEPDKGNDMLYAARERQRKGYWDDREWRKWLGLSVPKCLIGYGLGWRRFSYPLRWVVLFTVFGTLLLWSFGHQPEKDLLMLTIASFDQLLPVVTLDHAHEKLFSIATGTAATDGFEQHAGLIIYFYVHKFFGWLLGIFLLAGLAGLTQRS